uniref:Arrestin C-terminal-like domain-containing protein n=1 Tax=Plectus sambesii TaxID=2011161 RepID=A0A914WQ52_9BILA
MVKVDLFDVVFLNKHNVFEAGQELKGYIVVQLSQAIKVEDLRLKVKGKAQTQWSTHRGKTSTAYMGEEVYFDADLPLDYMKEFPDGHLSAGRHEVPFSYPLDAKLPSSYESAQGHIRYLCAATLKRPKLKFDLHVKRLFTVMAREDLNKIPLAKDPVELTANEEIMCCFASRGIVSVTISMNRRGFVPGEFLPLIIKVRNNSRKDVDVLQMRLKQYISYYGDTTFAGFKGRNDVTKEIIRIDRALNTAPGDEMTLDDLKFQIPSLPPSMSGCDIIDIRYGLKIDISSFIRLELPIIIGTVPVRAMPASKSVDDLDEYDSIGSDDTDMPSMTTPPQCGYRVSVTGPFRLNNDGNDDDDGGGGGDNNSEGTFGDREFAPVYAYYGADADVDAPAKATRRKKDCGLHEVDMCICD